MTVGCEIFVALLGEGTDVWRPVQGLLTGDHVYLLQGQIPSGESWQFSPGTHVRCEEHVFSDGELGMVAVEAIHV